MAAVAAAQRLRTQRQSPRRRSVVVSEEPRPSRFWFWTTERFSCSCGLPSRTTRRFFYIAPMRARTSVASSSCSARRRVWHGARLRCFRTCDLADGGSMGGTNAQTHERTNPLHFETHFSNHPYSITERRTHEPPPLRNAFFCPPRNQGEGAARLRREEIPTVLAHLSYARKKDFFSRVSAKAFFKGFFFRA